MASVTLKGSTIHTNGELPKVGSVAPDFVLVDAELKDRSLKDFKGKKKILSIVPSLDTSTCSLSAKKFNESAKEDLNLLILVISCDLPFAQKRLCGAENIQNIQTLSMMRSKDFASKYGVLIVDGPLAGIAARAIVVLDENDKVLYTELVSEIAQEPDYQKAVAAVKGFV
jgi:thiol peroxidase